ncbi:basic amino acid ABC transporter substrate-binding protein [Aquibacillus albus]|uniref:Polar amino acid transport system substrate-binding protein n=1 Tax=Aquibacillus albus TaxID=1168171 RepID=A0ABS2N358_9BACI|nr:basic amino acid ABC transporter substrate-binding protein [Aquibacillus albus]MBM7572575.1 polar amino acid transport system substrate-binding protein [Aquibacillus albus]
MKNRLTYFLLALLTMGLLILTACGTGTEEGADEGTNGTDTEEGANEDAKEERKVLQVGTDAAFAPFEYMEKGEITGFDVDLLEAVMAEAGYEYELKNTGWDPLFASLDTKSIDLGISAVTIDEERKESYDFSVPYFESTHMIVFNEGTDITSAEDLNGMRVGVQNGTTGQSAAEKILGKNSDNISKYETTAVAFMALTNGDVQAVVTDNVVANEFVKNNPNANVEAITDEDNFDSEFYGLIFPKGSELVEDFNEALTTVIENGTYEEIYQEWFGSEVDTEVILNAAE